MKFVNAAEVSKNLRCQLMSLTSGSYSPRNFTRIPRSTRLNKPVDKRVKGREGVALQTWHPLLWNMPVGAWACLTTHGPMDPWIEATDASLNHTPHNAPPEKIECLDMQRASASIQSECIFSLAEAPAGVCMHTSGVQQFTSQG